MPPVAPAPKGRMRAGLEGVRGHHGRDDGEYRERDFANHSQNPLPRRTSAIFALAKGRYRGDQLITSSARSTTDGGRVRWRLWAVLPLIANSKRVGPASGRSPGLAPWKILTT